MGEIKLTQTSNAGVGKKTGALEGRGKKKKLIQRNGTLVEYKILIIAKQYKQWQKRKMTEVKGKKY